VKHHHDVFAGKDDPEASQHGIEVSLADVRDEQHERHVKHQRQVLQWT